MGIDRRLAVLGSDHDQGRVVKVLCLQLPDECPNRGVDELEFAQQGLGGRACSIQISARHAVALLNELLAPLTAWKFMPKIVGTWVFLVPRWFFPSISLRIASTFKVS